MRVSRWGHVLKSTRSWGSLLWKIIGMSATQTVFSISLGLSSPSCQRACRLFGMSTCSYSKARPLAAYSRVLKTFKIVCRLCRRRLRRRLCRRRHRRCPSSRRCGFRPLKQVRFADGSYGVVLEGDLEVFAHHNAVHTFWVSIVKKHNRLWVNCDHSFVTSSRENSLGLSLCFLSLCSNVCFDVCYVP